MITGKMILTGGVTTTLKNGLYLIETFDDGFDYLEPNEGISRTAGHINNCATGNGTLASYVGSIFPPPYGTYGFPNNTISFWATGYVAITGINPYPGGFFSIIVNPDAGITVILEDEGGSYVRRVHSDTWNWGNWDHFVFVFNRNFSVSGYIPYTVKVYRNTALRSMSNQDFGEPSPAWNAGEDSTMTLNGKIDQYAVWEFERWLTEDEISLLYNNGNGLPYSQW